MYFNQGWDAAARGIPHDNNPYLPGTYAYAMWAHGWYAYSKEAPCA